MEQISESMYLLVHACASRRIYRHVIHCIDAPYHPPPEEFSNPYAAEKLKNLPPDRGYKVKLQHGVFHVYVDESAIARLVEQMLSNIYHVLLICTKWKVKWLQNHTHTTCVYIGNTLFACPSHDLAETLTPRFFLSREDPIDLCYPDLAEFIGDLNHMMAMVVNGPL